MTTSLGLQDYAQRHNRRIDWIDTSQSNFPQPSPVIRTLRAVERLIAFGWRAATCRYSGSVIFGGAGAGFYERSLMALIARVLGVRTALFIVDGHIVTFYNKNVALRPLINWLLSAPNIIGMQGDSWRAFYEKAGVPSSKMRVVRNWYRPPENVRRRPPKAEDGEVKFVAIGWVVEEKGVRELVAAAMTLARRGARFRLQIIGGGALLDEIEATIVHEDFGGRVTATGWLTPEQVAAQLNDADVLVHPSYAEGLPNALIEAMASGLAAIATRVGAIPDVLEEGASGFIVPPRDPVALAGAMQRYCDDPGLARIHGEHGAQYVRSHHDLDTNCALLFGLFEEASESGGSGQAAHG